MGGGCRTRTIVYRKREKLSMNKYIRRKKMVMKSKKSRVFLLCLFFVFAGGISGVYAQSLMGDANGDGVVNIIDALEIARYEADNTTPVNISQSDVNCDDMVDIIDALCVAQYCVGLLSEFTCVNPTPAPISNYVPGEIIVGFYDWVTLEEADNFIRSFELTWDEHFPTSFSIWMEVQDDPGEYITLLESYSIVTWVDLRGYFKGEPGKTYIIAHITGAREEADDLINTISGLTIVDYVFGNKWGVVDVPVGDESVWISVFTGQSTVAYASLNLIYTIN